MKPPSNPGERWAPVVGWEDRYFVSDLGRVFGTARGTIMRGTIIRDHAGREAGVSVQLQRDGYVERNSLPRLVLMAFGQEPEEGEVALHADEDKTHNALSNLRWGTRKEVRATSEVVKREIVARKAGPGRREISAEDVREMLRQASEIQRERGMRE